MSAPLEHTKTTIDASTWTPITTPFACNNVTLVNGDTTNQLKVRTDSTNANTELTIAAGGSYELLAPRSRSEQGHLPYRFIGTILYAQAVAGTGPVIGIFVA